MLQRLGERWDVGKAMEQRLHMLQRLGWPGRVLRGWEWLVSRQDQGAGISGSKTLGASTVLKYYQGVEFLVNFPQIPSSAAGEDDRLQAANTQRCAAICASCYRRHMQARCLS